ncbi:hypothetical protein JKF63_03584 [Porcisia hertigi]|uniref:Uncharacterized protein n=1 Tax=Porcisia hertigi TaxID=2761500 RepID=A0A836IBG6_9TRYP|nr:hypothetical protein JKF63_03584 [Porcisia hertigi]
MHNVYSSKDHETSLPWGRGAVTSQAPVSMPTQQWRKPKDDAPEYDPQMWSNTDTSYISTLATHAMTYQHPSTSEQPGLRHRGTAAFLSSSWKTTPQDNCAPPHSRFHSVQHRGPTTCFGSLIRWLLPGLYARWQGNVSPADVRRLSTKELISLMQLALSAGEVDQSAMLARELSSRKLTLQMSSFPKESVPPAAEEMVRGVPNPLNLRTPPTFPPPYPLASAGGDFNGGSSDGLSTAYPSGARGPSPAAASWQHQQSAATFHSSRFENQPSLSSLNVSSFRASDLLRPSFEYASPAPSRSGAGVWQSSFYGPGSNGT